MQLACVPRTSLKLRPVVAGYRMLSFSFLSGPTTNTALAESCKIKSDFSAALARSLHGSCTGVAAMHTVQVRNQIRCSPAGRTCPSHQGPGRRTCGPSRGLRHQQRAAAAFERAHHALKSHIQASSELTCESDIQNRRQMTAEAVSQRRNVLVEVSNDGVVHLAVGSVRLDVLDPPASRGEKQLQVTVVLASMKGRRH